MKLFVTGATGFIGSHFINAALGAGHSIVALKRLNSVPRVKLIGQPEWVDGELGDDVSNALNDCEIFVHLAAYGVSPQPTNWYQAFYWNVLRAVITWEQAIDRGIHKIIILGSSHEYGLSSLSYKTIPPTARLEPIGPYATSKVASCMAAQGLCREKQIKLKYLRGFSVYGEGQHIDNFWPSLKKAAYAGNDFKMTLGEQVRDFIPVGDFSKLLLSHLSFADVLPGVPYIKNIGSDNPRTVLEFATTLWEEWGAKGRLLPGALPYRDNELMCSVPQL